MIHKYKFRDFFVVIDVNSGAVHKVSEQVNYLLDQFNEDDFKKNKIDIDKTVRETTFERKDIEDAIKEIQFLIKEDLLFSAEIKTDEMRKKDSDMVVKALCLHVAHDCNMKCEYCFAEQGDFDGERGLMSFNTGKKALDFLLENSGSRYNLEVDFFGGEPLMNFQVVKELVAYGRESEKTHNKNIRFTITTNGLLLDEDNITFINEHMDNVVLSIDGRKEVNDRIRKTWNNEGTYDEIVEKYKDLIKERTGKYYVRGTFTKFNLDFSKDVLHLHEAGFDNVSIEPVVLDSKEICAITEDHKGTILKEYDRLAELMVEKIDVGSSLEFFHFNVDLDQGPCMVKRISGCGAGTEYLAITPEGDIYPCHRFVGMENFKLGSLENEKFENKMAHEFNALSIYDKEACENCWAKFYCSGGCHANAYLENGHMDQPYELGCDLERKRIECAIGLKAYK